jgi:hypothetical protein
MTTELRRTEVTADSDLLSVTGVQHTGVVPIDMKWAALWSESCPAANIGIRTGAASGLLVLDLDPRNGAPADRLELVQQLGPIPETAEVTTGGGGRHIYFRNSGKKLRHSIASGVELKTDGGYVVVPPSVHPNGELYQWDGIRGERALLSPAEAPDWLLTLAEPENQSRVVSLNTREKWPISCRIDRLMSIAGSMRRRDMAESAILKVLLQENELKCDPPLSTHEVEQVVKMVMRYEPVAEAARTEDSLRISGINWPQAIGPQAYIGVADGTATPPANIFAKSVSDDITLEIGCAIIAALRAKG